MRFKVLFIFYNILICHLLRAQNISITTDKKVYDLGEKIELTIQNTSKTDSIYLPPSSGLMQLKGAGKNSSISIKDGKMTYKNTWVYFLRPTKSGKLTIESPVLIIGGKEVKTKSLKIEVREGRLSPEELEEWRFNDFVEGNNTENTYRYVLNEEFGYIEIYKSFVWKFYRRLTDEELEMIRGVH